MIPLENRTVAKIAAGWVLIALFAGETGLLGLLPPGGVQLILFTLAALLLGFYGGAQRFRAWVDRVPIRAIVAFHLVRFVGFYFLALYAQGRLPYEFAVIGGWGDIIIASSALILVSFQRLAASRPIILVWNLAGLADILFVVISAAKMGRTKPDSLQPLLELPLSFLPTLIVPLIISSHLIIFWRLYLDHKRSGKKTGLTSFFAKEGARQFFNL